MRSGKVDSLTILLFALYVGLLASSLAGAAAGRIPLPWAFLASLLAFNLSFTLWHECVHNTVSSERWLCAAIGVATSFLLLYPGYYAARRDHLLHHKYQGNPDLDPVYPRIQCRPWAFPLHLARSLLFNPQPPHKELNLTKSESLIDASQYLCVAGLAILAMTHELGSALLWAWVLPRLIILPIHAFYVCYLPHSGEGKRLYQTYRIILRNPLTRYLTLYHGYHGLHHLWPSIPWHRYQKTFRARGQELKDIGVEILEAT